VAQLAIWLTVYGLLLLFSLGSTPRHMYLIFFFYASADSDVLDTLPQRKFLCIWSD